MEGTSVIYYPPTTGHPYLVVTFRPDPAGDTFDSEEEAETFIERDAPRLPS